MAEMDTADCTGTVEQCLYSLGNRIEIAKLLYRMGEEKLLETELEDIAFFTQQMTDEYCVQKDRQ